MAPPRWIAVHREAGTEILDGRTPSDPGVVLADPDGRTALVAGPRGLWLHDAAGRSLPVNDRDEEIDGR